MKILLDTHILLRAANQTLEPSRLELLESPAAKLFVSCISLWEITKLVEHQRIAIEEGLDYFLERVYLGSKYSIVDLLPEVLLLIPSIAKKIGKDPADQIIVATAIYLSAKLMSDDEKIHESRLIPML